MSDLQAFYGPNAGYVLEQYDRYLSDLADAVAGKLGGQIGIAPRLFLKKLVGDVLDRVELAVLLDGHMGAE